MAGRPTVDSLVTVTSSGRKGKITVDDGSDMPFKVVFQDGASPEADWFAENDVSSDAAAGGASPSSTQDEVKNRALSTFSAGSSARLVRRKSTQEGVLSNACQLSVLQGDWVNKSTGAKVTVDGKSVSLNGNLLTGHEIFERDDNTVRSFSQKKNMNRRMTVGVEWSSPVASSNEGGVQECEWTCYGTREVGNALEVIWREADREVIWERKEEIVTLAEMQGDWVNSMGAKIVIKDTLVSLNGLPMKAHPIRMREDGAVQSIGMLWQLKGWLDDKQLEFKEAPSREVMTYARSVIWTRATEERMKEWTSQMNSLGYSGSSSDPLHRGVEGCVPGTSDAKAQVQSADRDREEAELLSCLIHEFSEPKLASVTPIKVIPDYTNRAETGLSLEHVHFIAKSMTDKGFQPRSDNGGHDIPVLVREEPGSSTGQDAVKKWKDRLASETSDGAGFAPWYLDDSQEFFCSLGNGHFYQALNVIRSGGETMYNVGDHYTIGSDAKLREAIDVGVPSLIISNRAPRKVRAKISELLNSKREYRWVLTEDGEVVIDTMEESDAKVSQFEALSKFLDAEELNCLVRSHMGVKDSKRAGT